MRPTPEEFFAQVIRRWEGLYQNDPRDTGNWAGGKLIGTMRGITPGALAEHLGCDPTAVTVEMIKNVTEGLAVEIAMKGYFFKPKFDLLTWGPATAAIADWGYMSGPVTASRHVQRLVSVPADGAVGPITAAAYNEWHEAVGEGTACNVIRLDRIRFFQSLRRPEYEAGWINRANWASPVNAEFWKQWQ